MSSDNGVSQEHATKAEEFKNKANDFFKGVCRPQARGNGQCSVELSKLIGWPEAYTTVLI